MNYIISIFFGIIQGITEFLPVSSSGHLIIFHEIFKLPVENEMAFDVALHFATLLAVIFFFRKDLFQLIKSWLRSLAGKKDEYSKISWFIILGTIPAAIVGWFFDDTIENFLRSPFVVIIMLVIIGAFFIIFEKISKFKKDITDMSWKDSVVIGLAQAVALIPGTSRSGITIIAGIGSGLKREAALRFSFLLSIPIIFGAVIKKTPQIISDNLSVNDYSILLIAFLSAFVSGILAIKYFLLFSRKHSLNVFAVYRFVLAGVLLVYLFWPS